MEQGPNSTSSHVESDPLPSSLATSVLEHTSQEIGFEPLPPTGRPWYHWKGQFDDTSQVSLRPPELYKNASHSDETHREAASAYSQGSVVGLGLYLLEDLPLGPPGMPHLRLRSGSFQDRRSKNPRLQAVTNNPEVLLDPSVRSAVSELDMYCQNPANTAEGLQDKVDSVIKDLNSTGSSIVTRLDNTGVLRGLRTNHIVHDLSKFSAGTIATLSGQDVIAVAQTDGDESTRRFFVHRNNKAPKIDPQTPSSINHIASLTQADFDEAFGASWTKSVTVGDFPCSFVRVPIEDVTELALDPNKDHHMYEVPSKLYTPS